MDSTDDFGQKPIHSAALSNKPEVVKLFLKQRANLVSVSTKVNENCWVLELVQSKWKIENVSLDFFQKEWKKILLMKTSV